MTAPIRELRRGDLVLDVHDTGAGAPEGGGEVVVLLHGWPADASCWDGVTDGLVAAGHRVVALDHRGTSPGARPRRRRAYRMPELVGDVVALLDAVGPRPVHLVGHDWGGAIAWAVAADHPDRLASLTVLSTPHPSAMVGSLTTSLQLARSAYMGLFQVPAVPERLLSARRGALLRRLLLRSGLPAEHADRYVARLSAPGALSASLGWYRALPLGSPTIGDVSVPTLYVWSSDDVALGRKAAELTADHVTGPYRFEVLDGVPHWVPEVRPDAVVELTLEHIASVRS